ncbi:NTP transferase domain-containing protein [Thalassobellus suaedae]|uniref:Phosphocholine cytidylyltransferase family protein n=1 Tax=Thalassobellus suaedae TaxID=3074124 RepID=A0ABY9Y3S0_9FLAO|nr:phosphocholine cytidylyltransferase family protein [Flavobacteriaceae bacterium HL-DH14]WNH12882.1 phosphocholine cytidylyltransferase family protein [Flavobacteriaceae bacterium HL-DH10]
MKIVILAAGMGSRLGNPFPKPLTPLKNGKSIMKMQTDNIASRYNIDDISVVVGFKKDLIMERFPELSYVYNPFFDRTNTSKSLLQVLKKNRDKSVLWFNGDVVFDEKILDILNPFIESNQSFVAVNTSKVADEEVKYTLKEGFIDELSKTVENGLGEAVGINFISSNDIQDFIKRLEECDANDYFERGLELAIEKDNLKIKAVDISKYNCMEIDFIEDLENANNLL